jgi:hypothetical protein
MRRTLGMNRPRRKSFLALRQQILQRVHPLEEIGQPAVQHF